MKKTLLWIALALPAFAQQSFDFSLLDRLGANAKNKTNITLDGDMLKMASAILPADKDADGVKKLVDSLKGIHIRTYEFDKPGSYNPADLEPFRAFLRQQNWTRIVDSVEENEHSEIYAQSKQPGQFGGIAIVSAEPKELTVVYISGNMSVEDIARLGGKMGIPDITFNRSGAPKGKKEE